MRGKMVAVFDMFSVYLDFLYAFFWAIPRRLKYIYIYIYVYIYIYISKGKVARYRPGVAQRVPGS
jgi:hypothetical protein